MAYDGTLKFDTSMDASGFQKGINKLGSIVGGLTVFSVLQKGFQMITESIDAAMGRLDTMDQFRRVMTTMTGSVGSANAALAETNDIVAGTAYGLDTASKGVQAFVNSGMQVQRATDTMERWGDATSFYTKGTNAELETVSTALQKMQTKGTVTMEHLQMLLEAGIPAVQIYADAVGISTDEVTDAMGRGELKTSEFISVMNTAFETGTAGFPSVAGAAKQAGASWSGSIDNMKAAIARGTASILTSFDDIFNVKSGMVTFGKTIEKVMKGIADNMDIIAPVTMVAVGALIAYKAAMGISSAMNAFVTAQKAAVGVMSLVTAGASAETLSTLSLTSAQIAQGTVLAALSTGNITAAVSTGGLTAAQTIQTAVIGVLSGQITFATAVQYLWNAAMAANPIGVIITLIALLVTGLTVLMIALNRGSEAYRQQKQEIEDLTSAMDDHIAALDTSASAYQKNLVEVKTTKTETEALVARLKELEGVQNKSAEQTAETASITADLNEAIGNEGEALSMAADEWDEYITAKNKIAETNLYQERANELQEQGNQLEADNQILAEKMKSINEDETLSWLEKFNLLKDVADQYDENNDAIKENAREIKAAEKIVVDSNTKEEQAIVNKSEALSGATTSDGKNLKQLAKEYGITTDQILGSMKAQGLSMQEWADKKEKSLTAEGANIRQVAAKWGMTTDEVQGYMDEWGMSLDEFSTEMEETHTKEGLSIEQLAVKWGTTTQAIKDEMAIQGINMQEWSDNQDQALEEWRATVEENTNLIVNDFADLPTELDVSFDEMVTALNENAEKYDEWRGKLVEASGMLTTEALSRLEALGPGTSDILDAIIEDTTGTKAAEMNAAWANVGDSAASGYGTAITNSTAPDEASQQIVDDVTTNFEDGDYSGLTTEIESAIDLGTGGVVASVEIMSAGVLGRVNTMSTMVNFAVSTMMSRVTTTILTGKKNVLAAVDIVSSGVTAKFGFMATQATDIVDNMMLGMLQGMIDWAPTLYAKADEIAKEIVRRIKAAYEEHSPSRVMIGIYSNVVKGMIVGLEGEKKSLYSSVDDLTGGFLSRFGSLEGVDIGSLQMDLGNTVAATRSGIIPAAAAYAGAGNTSYSNDDNSRNVTQEIHFDQPIETPSQVARAVRKAGEELANG